MPPLVKEFFPTLTVSEGKAEGKEEKNSSFFLSSALPFFLLEIFNTVKSKCNTRTTKRWIRTNISARQQETQMYRTVSWTLWERVRVGWSGRMAMKHVYYHMWNRSPVQVRCMRQGARVPWVHWDEPVGWDGEVGGRGIQDGEHMYTQGWFM